MSRRLAIYIMLTIGVGIFSVGCKGFNSKGKSSTSEKGEEELNPVSSSINAKSALKSGTQKPTVTSQGKVMLVDQALGFCVINFMFVAQLPSSEKRYFVYRGDQQVGEIVTTAQTDETFLVADINKGDIREGDLVRPD